MLITTVLQNIIMSTDDNSQNIKQICEIDHPLFDVIDNVTRRQVLRLIACEHNYGNRIASILDLSTPAIHRHLKYLGGDNKGGLKLISAGKKTKTSHSGHKGGEATLYKVDAKVGLFFHIYPNFVHNHILTVNDGEAEVIKEEEKSDTLKYLVPKKTMVNWKNNENPETIIGKLIEISEYKKNKQKKELEKIGTDKLKAAFYSIYETVQKSNNKIKEMEEEMMNLLSIKNDFMEVVDTILKAHQSLTYEDRVILRAITCLGKHCSADLSHLMNMDSYIIERYVEQLKEKDWLE